MDSATMQDNDPGDPPPLQSPAAASSFAELLRRLAAEHQREVSELQGRLGRLQEDWRCEACRSVLKSQSAGPAAYPKPRRMSECVLPTHLIRPLEPPAPLHLAQSEGCWSSESSGVGSAGLRALHRPRRSWSQPEKGLSLHGAPAAAAVTAVASTASSNAAAAAEATAAEAPAAVVVVQPTPPAQSPPALVLSEGSEALVRTVSRSRRPSEADVPSHVPSGYSVANSAGDGQGALVRKVAQPLFRDSAALHWRQALHKLQALESAAQDSCWYTFRYKFEMVVAGVIILNTIFIGWQVQHRAVHREPSTVDAVGGIFFCVVYCADLLVRLRHEGCRGFFLGQDRRWNWFDAVVVLVMVIEEVMRLATHGTSLIERLFVLRAVRLLRLVRLLYIVRVFSVFDQFQILVRTIQCSCRAGFFMLTATIALLCVAGIGLTEGTYEHCGDGGSALPVCTYFGTLDASLIYLYEALFGGILWGDLLEALRVLDFVYPVLFVLLVSFISIIVLNTVTAVFLELKEEIACRPEARMREKQKHIEKLHVIFESLDLNDSGDISQSDFAHALENPRLEGLLATLKLDVDDAKAVFDLLDRDQTGVVDRTEFVLGCLHLKGEAKALDVVRLQAANNSLLEHVLEVQRRLEMMSDAHARQPAGEAWEMKAVGVAPCDEQREERPVGQRVAQPNQTPACTTPRSRPGVRGACARKGCCIEKVEERAMSLRELNAVRREILRRCEEEGWEDLRVGGALRPEEVNLYHLTHFHVCPLTTVAGTVLRGLEQGSYTQGQNVAQRDISGRQLAPLAEGYVEEVEKDGSLRVSIVRGRFVCGSPVTIDEVDVGTPEEVASPGAVSYKELVSNRPLKPRWFCTHWWGEPVLDFIACCEVHSKLRALSADEASFWVCAYANCQHNLQADITQDPEHSSFRKAMKLAEGVLLVLDANATPFQRIWCDFELYKTISADRKLLDIVTVHEGRPRLLSEDCLPNETQHYKSLREQQFPTRLLVEGMRRRLEEGEASVDKDRENILASMAQDAACSGSHEERLAHALQQANNALHAYFSLAAWSFAVNSGIVEDFDQRHPGTLSLPEVLERDSGRQHMALSLAHSSRIQDNDVRVLARGLPPNLLELRLSFDGCPNITDTGVKLLAENLPAGLRKLALDFSNCKDVTDTALQSLAEELPHGLLELDLYFAHCSEVGPLGATALASSLPPNLQRLFVTMLDTQVNRTFETAAALRRFVGSQKSNGYRGLVQRLTIRGTQQNT